MIGKKVSIINKESQYIGHWGFIKQWDGRWFHIGGGSISGKYGEITPVFERDEFKVMSK
jgi:hypothetical protein